MKIFNILFLLLVFLFPGKAAWGQKIFREGFIVKKNGESLNGLVQFSTNQDIPSICIFKRFDIARAIDYTPDEIVAFGYKNGNRYEAKEINNKKSFIEVFIMGEITLYNVKSKYYIEKDHSGLIELKDGGIIYKSGTETKEFNKLSEFLRYITEGKTGTISDRFNLKKDISPLILSYNKQSGKNYYVFNRSITEEQISRQVLESGSSVNKFGVLSGVNLYSLNVKQNKNYSGILPTDYLLNPKLANSVVLGLTYERQLSRKSDRFSLRLDLLYTKQTFYSFGKRPNNVSGTTIDDAYFGFTGIKFPILLQYSFTGRRIIPFVNTGVASQNFIDKNYIHIAEEENSYHEISTTTDSKIKLKAGELTAIAGVGLKTRIFNNLALNISGRIEYGSGMFYNKIKNYAPTDYMKPFLERSVQSTLLIGITF
jgi:hypothetical protein